MAKCCSLKMTGICSGVACPIGVSHESNWFPCSLQEKWVKAAVKAAEFVIKTTEASKKASADK